jgi:hypothetical protein
MDVPVELSRIVIVETQPQQVIFLREKEGERTFPIMIGIHEALAIDRRLKGYELPRPLTHDLLGRVIEEMGGRLDRVVVSDLRDHTFFAVLVIRLDGEEIEVDSRPSDAIALAVGLDTPLFVSEHVFDEVANDAISVLSQSNQLVQRRDELAGQIAAAEAGLQDDEVVAEMDETQLRQVRRRLREMKAELEAIEEILRQLP